MSRDGFYGIDQSETSAQGPEYTIRARPWMESVPGPLKRGQEKCSCPLLSGPGTNQELLFARFFFLEMARPSFELAFDEEIIEAPPKKIFRFASVDEASMDKLDMKRVPDATRKTTEKWLRIAKQYFEEKQIECDFRTVAKEDLSRLLRQMSIERN